MVARQPALTMLHSLQTALEVSREMLDGGRDILRRQQNLMLETAIRIMRARAGPARRGCQVLDSIATQAMNAGTSQLRHASAKPDGEEAGKEAIH